MCVHGSLWSEVSMFMKYNPIVEELGPWSTEVRAFSMH